MKWIQPIILLLMWQAGICQQTGLPLVIRQNQLSGLIDTDGKIVLAPVYQEIRYQANVNMFLVHNKAGVALFSPEQKMMVTGFYDKVEVLNKKLFIVTSNSKCGLVKAPAQQIIPPRYLRIEQTLNGNFIADDGYRLTIYDTAGNAANSFEAQDAFEIYNYFVFRSADNLYGLANRAGEILAPAMFSEYSSDGNLIELKNADSLFVLHPRSGKLLRFGTETQVRFAKQTLWSLYAAPFYSTKNSSDYKWHTVYGNEPLKVNLKDASVDGSPVAGCYIVYSGNVWLIDSLGNSYTDEKYQGIRHFTDRKFIVQQDDKVGLFDLDSGLVLKIQYSYFYLQTDTIVGRRWIIAVNTNGRQLLNEQGVQVLPGDYSFFRLEQGRGFVAGTNENKMMLLDTDGRQICRPLYDSILFISGDLCRVKIGVRQGVMTTRGEVLTDIKYNEISIIDNVIKCVYGDIVDFFSWDGMALEPMVIYDNYRRLNVMGTVLLQPAAIMAGQGGLAWRRDTLIGKFGLINVATQQYLIPPTYDYVKVDPKRDISFTGIFGTMSYFNIGPLRFMGRLKLGIVDHLSGRIIAPNEYMFLYFENFLYHFVESTDKVTINYGTNYNMSVGIDSLGKWRTISYTGLTYYPNVQFISKLRSSAKVWRFDSCYVALNSKNKTDKKICNIYSSLHSLQEFLRPVDTFTDSVMKNKKLNLYTVNPDSLKLQRGVGERRDPGLVIFPNRSKTPMFLNKYVHTQLIERRGNLFCNMKCFNSKIRYTFIDSSGYAISDPVFTKAFPFSDGLALVKKDNSFGYINHLGEMVIEEKFRKATSFSEGKAVVSLKGAKYGYIGTDGEWVIDDVYREALPFSEGLAAVKPAELFGYIDESGNMVIAPKWYRANPFLNGTATVYSKRGFGLIDRSGKSLLRCKYNRIEPPDLYRNRKVSKGAKFFLVNEKGEKISKKSKSITVAGEGYYSMQKKSGFTLISSDGSEIVSIDSDRPLLVGDGLVLVSRRNRFYYYDLKGNQLFGPYKKAAVFSHGRAIVSTKNESMLIGLNGNVLRQISTYGWLSAVEPFDSNGTAVVRSSNYYYLTDTAGNFLYEGLYRPKVTGENMCVLFNDGYYMYNYTTDISYPFSKWNKIEGPSEGLYKVTSNGMFGFSDIFGQYYSKMAYTHIEYVQPGIYRIYYGDKTGYIRYNGDIIWDLSR